jgi:hypothetical protein
VNDFACADGPRIQSEDSDRVRRQVGRQRHFALVGVEATVFVFAVHRLNTERVLDIQHRSVQHHCSANAARSRLIDRESVGLGEALDSLHRCGRRRVPLAVLRPVHGFAHQKHRGQRQLTLQKDGDGNFLLWRCRAEQRVGR